jgi:hypothetical protein
MLGIRQERVEQIAHGKRNVAGHCKFSCNVLVIKNLVLSAQENINLF